MSEQKILKSGMAMVQISGSTLRMLREKQGVTQLYLATAVEVTTETISRWERQDAPTLKEENAVKLADVLDVPLQDLLAMEKPVAEVARITDSLPVNRKKIVVIVFAIFLGFLILLFLLASGEQVANFSATRLVPGHTVSGQVFPVLIEVELTGEDNSSLLLKEHLPSGCSVVRSMPEATAVGDGFLKWVARNVADKRLFAYLATCVGDMQSQQDLLFQGTLLVGQSRRPEISVGGQSRLLLTQYHWADSDQNNIIDDEELLAVYDEFDLVKGLNIDVETIESIWMGSGYTWNPAQSAFKIVP